MAQYIDKDAVLAGIERRLHQLTDAAFDSMIGRNLIEIKDFLNTLEVKELGVDLGDSKGDKSAKNIIDTKNPGVKEAGLYNNGWIDCSKQMPPETKQTSDTLLQGHREWTESDLVLAWDSSYGCRVDFTKNGKWMSEQRGGYTGQIVHGIIAWRPIPEFSEELLLKAQKGE